MQTFRFIERNFERVIITAALFAMSLILILQVFMRYFLRSPFVWSEEVSRYLLVWCAVLGVSLAVRESRNISVDFLPMMLGERTVRFFALVAHGGVLIFSIIMVTSSVPLIQRLAAIGQTSPALNIPMWMVYAAVPVGFTFTTLRTIQAIYFNLVQPQEMPTRTGVQ